MTDLLIRNTAAIVTGLPGAAARHAGPDIRLRQGRITALGQLTPEPGETILDATDCVAYPAWVNTHHHLFQSLLKGDPLGLNATLTPWLTAIPYRYRAAFDADLFRLAARIGLVELALSGCGTVADHNYLYAPGLDFDTSAILFEEAAALGLRFVLLRGGQTRSRQVESTLPQALRPETPEAYLADIQRLAAAYHDPAPDAWRKVAVAPTTPLHAVHPQELDLFAAEARRLGLRLHSHLSETVSYQDAAQDMHGTTPIRFCADHGWLGPDVSFAHLVKLDPEEIRLLGQTHTGIAHCPQSNGRLGSGIAPVLALEAAGAQISIGVDGAASNEAADMLSETHAAWLMQRARNGEAARPHCRGGQGEAQAAAAPTVEDVVRWGSAGGADLLGLTGLGRLAVGQAADIALYRLDQPCHLGLHDPAIGPVAGGKATLKRLLVGGKTVVEDGRIPGLDLAQLSHQARAGVTQLRQGAAG
ncbi:amidohydrolase family protein [Azospira inquinata]|uniref:Amidohydrolase family protein n=1 Tax=Azospira inquinata TaxID=2785627 RepID=A0A975SKU1_9RHOO|nr:amidohydrolase family protein [Azospira inquinata]QWT46529.1 amidohydrolase family protein [Azospira inquinata]QWT48147.1 amidohydrolase family protein [Azospira inquinata]